MSCSMNLKEYFSHNGKYKTIICFAVQNKNYFNLMEKDTVKNKINLTLIYHNHICLFYIHF